MKRIKDSAIHEWFLSKYRKPLVLRGARQVGKSTLVRNFAQSQKLELLEINLERYPYLDGVFATFNLDTIFENLFNLPNIKKIDLQKPYLLFLDEIQATPHALAALRYFYEERPEIPVVAAGSLLEFTLSDHKFSMPVGRIQYLHLSPMSFTEFLMALEEDQLLETLSTFSLKKSINQTAHQRLSEIFKIYSFVGGMPEAVQRYIDTKDLKQVREIQNSLCDNYKDDFSKYGSKQDLVKLHQVFDDSVRQIGRKIKYVNILPQEQARVTKRILDLLTQAKILNQIIYSHSNGIPLSAEADLKTFKITFLDVGLANSLLQIPYLDLKNTSNFLSLYNGAIAEQIAAQELLASDLFEGKQQLYYWMREKKSNSAEIDFITVVSGKILPIEVKSGASGTLRSLHQFALEKQIKRAVRFDNNLPQTQDVKITIQNETCHYLLISLPIYASGQMNRILGDELLS